MPRERVLNPLRHWRRGDGRLTEDPRTFAFALAALNWMGATVSALWLLLPHPDGARVTPIIIATLAAYVLGVLLLAGSRPHPSWMFQAAVALDTLVISVALVATGDPGSEYAFYYLWATLYAVCFFNARQIALQGVWACLAYALSLALIGGRPAGALVAQWMLPMATLLAAGTLVRQLTGAAPPQRGAAPPRRRPRCPHRSSQPCLLRLAAR